jgi:hypothetical protein
MYHPFFQFVLPRLGQVALDALLYLNFLQLPPLQLVARWPVLYYGLPLVLMGVLAYISRDPLGLGIVFAGHLVTFYCIQRHLPEARKNELEERMIHCVGLCFVRVPSPKGEGVCGPARRRMRGRRVDAARIRDSMARLPLISRLRRQLPPQGKPFNKNSPAPRGTGAEI